ncbi:MAG: hypothetical protein EB127_24670, partial [Alphaproteobacteria bacterium]|nr:hypothetical protein [Alphaproteobacteria bacterium]
MFLKKYVSLYVDIRIESMYFLDSISICPVCKRKHSNHPRFSTAVCVECLDKYKTKDRLGYVIDYGFRKSICVEGEDSTFDIDTIDDIDLNYVDEFRNPKDEDSLNIDEIHNRYQFYSLKNGMYGKERDCFVNDVPCYVFDNLDEIVVLGTIEVISPRSSKAAKSRPRSQYQYQSK